MDVDLPLALLGGLSPAAFMRRHWQRRPLLVRQAMPGVRPPLTRSALFSLAADDDVESRLVRREPAAARRGRGHGHGHGSDERWSLAHGPFTRRALPPIARPGWTLLVQGLDLHVDAAHELLARFRFVPDARLDDLMVSWASDGGGVGPHRDSYDVFLLQVSGRRRWRIGRSRDDSLREDVPLKMLARFEPEQDWLLEPGDMLYLPPGWAHDGVADGECMTCSIGFRSPTAGELARELLQRLADGSDDGPRERRYRDPSQAATDHPGALPEALQRFGAQALATALREPDAVARALGEWATEPKPQVWFEAAASTPLLEHGVALDRRTRMMYDARHVFINGEAYRAGGRDARLMRRLADERSLDGAAVGRLGEEARALLAQWTQAGWLRARD